MQTFPNVVFRSQFIQNIRILSTGSGDSPEDTSPKKDDTGISGRAQRREMLRNIPNACNAYVCPDSPPLIHRSVGIPIQPPVQSSSPGVPGAVNMKQLDPALASISLSGKTDRKQSKQTKQNSVTPMKRRSRSCKFCLPRGVTFLSPFLLSSFPLIVSVIFHKTFRSVLKLYHLFL